MAVRKEPPCLELPKTQASVTVARSLAGHGDDRHLDLLDDHGLLGYLFHNASSFRVIYAKPISRRTPQ